MIPFAAAPIKMSRAVFFRGIYSTFSPSFSADCEDCADFLGREQAGDGFCDYAQNDDVRARLPCVALSALRSLGEAGLAKQGNRNRFLNEDTETQRRRR